MKLRLTALALLVGGTITPIGWSRIAPSPPVRGEAHGAATAPIHQVAANPSLAISLASIVWHGNEATALDARGQRHPLTLQRPLQTIASQLLRQAMPSRGAVVALSVADGRILALNEFPSTSSHQDSLVWSANTPSASLFKLVTTAALVERAQLSPDHRVCTEGGEHRLELRHLAAPKEGRIVCSNFEEILVWSRNAAYARLVHTHLTPEDLENFADRFGFNSPLPADVPAELGRFRVADNPLLFARTATGFVGSSLSVLGAAYLAFVIARDGSALPLRLLDHEGPTDSPATTDATPSLYTLKTAMTGSRSGQPFQILGTNTAHRLRSMMERVVSHGTAAPAFHDDSGHPIVPHQSVAGKTGTLGREDGTASWFIGFAPSRAPEVVIAVLLDNGSIWHKTAKSVASNLFREYFEQRRLQASNVH